MTDGYVTLHHTELDLDSIEVLPGQVPAFESVGWQRPDAAGTDTDQRPADQAAPTTTPPPRGRGKSKE